MIYVEAKKAFALFCAAVHAHLVRAASMRIDTQTARSKTAACAQLWTPTVTTTFFAKCGWSITSSRECNLDRSPFCFSR